MPPTAWLRGVAIRRPMGAEPHSLDSCGFVRIDEIAELFRWFEIGYALGWDVHAVACLWITADAGIALPDAEGAEAANLNFISRLQGRNH